MKEGEALRGASQVKRAPENPAWFEFELKKNLFSRLLQETFFRELSKEKDVFVYKIPKCNNNHHEIRIDGNYLKGNTANIGWACHFHSTNFPKKTTKRQREKECCVN